MATENGKSEKYSPGDGEARKLDRFVRKVLTARDTPDLIRMLAGDGELLTLCKTLVGIVPEKEPVLWGTFSATCRKRGVDPVRIRERLIPAARSLGIGLGSEKQADYYALLGVEPSAPFEAIQKAFHQKAKVLHPDTQSGRERDGAAFIRVNEAYSVLKDPMLRRHYDESRRSMDAWCELPACTFDEPESPARTTGRMRIVMQIGGVVVLLMILTLVFSAFYETHSLRDGFQEAYLRHPNPQEKAPVSVTASEENAAPVVEEKKRMEPVREVPRHEAEKDRLSSTDIETSAHSATDKEIKETTSTEAKIKPFYSRRKDLNPPVNNPAAVKKAKEKGIFSTEAQAVSEGEGIQNDAVREIEEKEVTERTPAPAASPRVSKPSEPAGPRAAAGTLDPQAVAMVQKYADESEEIEGIKAFIRSYCAVYEQKDLTTFSRYFSEDAVENDKAFAACAPNYRKTFRAIEKLEYDVNLYRFSYLLDSEVVRVEGTYRIAWQVYGGTRQEGTGNILFDLIKRNGSYRVKRLRYSEIK